MFGNPGTVEQGFLDALGELPRDAVHHDAAGDDRGRDGRRLRPRDAAADASSSCTAASGLGNGIGMMYQAKRGGAPLVVIAGEAGVRYDSMDAQMAADLVSMAKPVTKWATRVIDPSSTLRVLRRAIKMAATPPTGPVFVGAADGRARRASSRRRSCRRRSRTRASRRPPRPCATRSRCSRARRGRSSIIGDGIAFSGAQAELTRVAELLGAEVWGANFSEVNIAADASALPRPARAHVRRAQPRRSPSQADAVLICGTYVFPEVFPALEGVFAPARRSSTSTSTPTRSRRTSRSTSGSSPTRS